MIVNELNSRCKREGYRNRQAEAYQSNFKLKCCDMLIILFLESAYSMKHCMCTECWQHGNVFLFSLLDGPWHIAMNS
jgi:hypothetical protein